MRYAAQQGISLVEMQLALVLGLLVSLAGGRLFLETLDNTRAIEVLGERQATLIYAAESLMGAIRRGEFESGRYVLVDNALGPGCTLYDRSASQPLADGLAPSASSCAASTPVEANVDGRAGLYHLRLRPLGAEAALLLHAMDRRLALIGRDAGEVP